MLPPKMAEASTSQHAARLVGIEASYHICIAITSTMEEAVGECDIFTSAAGHFSIIALEPVS